jgi:single-stranded-DNA-specific exonuclease
LTQGWKTQAVSAAIVDNLVSGCGVARIVAHALAARGIDDPQAARDFLRPDLGRDWSDPALIPGMLGVCDALEAAIRQQQRILVFGDFDVDGITATALMLRGLAALGVQADYLIPNRIDEGYGLTAAALERVFEKAPELVLTVDCGISSKLEVQQLLNRGIAVLVTDHHQPSDLVPEGIPLTDPKLEDDSPAAILAGVGVALKLMAMLGQRFGQPGLWLELVDLATLGTLADIMPLTGENRSLVARGLELLNCSSRPGIASLLALSRRQPDALKATDLSFTLIPRLNAAGRMGDPDLALRLLSDDDPANALGNAESLDAANSLRRRIESEVLDIALKQAEDGYHGQKIIIVAGPNWHEGVKGIVASRLVNRFGLPAIVFSVVDGEARGSGRSVGSINLFECVQSCAGLAKRFGGHQAAVGVTVAIEDLDEFRSRIEDVAAALPEQSFERQLTVDAELALAQLQLDAVAQLELLEPFGPGNPEPLFVSRNLALSGCRAVGAQKSHFSFTAGDGQHSLSGIWFQCPCIDELSRYKGKADIVYSPRVDEFNGRRRVKLMVSAIHKSDAVAADAWADGAQQPVGQPALAQPADRAASNAEKPGPLGSVALPHSEGGQEGEGTAAVNASATTADAPSAGPGVAPPSPQQLAERIVGAPIQLHQAQQAALEILESGQSLLAIMATGRGKSLVFQCHAARLALSERKASIFIYPLRALIADQQLQLAAGFGRLGLSCRALTGENSMAEKDALFAELYAGSVDALLTTPEFFRLHIWRFAQSGRIGLIVFDEAHHLATELQLERQAYHLLRSARTDFPDAQFLAVSATADDRISNDICQSLAIGQLVIDDSRRDNLLVDDARGAKDRDACLTGIIGRAAKTIVYVNSRSSAVVLTRMLRKQFPDRGEATAYYHAGMSRQQRQSVEAGFRSGAISTIISTSAFGEGVNIPDVSDVVLYHLPFSDVAFNQMSGRGGRNGQPATVHLLWSDADLELNRRILANLAPSRSQLVTLYRALREMARQQQRPWQGQPQKQQPGQQPGDGGQLQSGGPGRHQDGGQGRAAGLTTIALTRAALLQSCRQFDDGSEIDEDAVLAGLAIFEELGLIGYDDIGSELHVSMPPSLPKVELGDSSRYQEAAEELLLFERFQGWVLSASADELRQRITGPLVPVALMDACVRQ